MTNSAKLENAIQRRDDLIERFEGLGDAHELMGMLFDEIGEDLDKNWLWYLPFWPFNRKFKAYNRVFRIMEYILQEVSRTYDELVTVTYYLKSLSPEELKRALERN